MRKPQSMTTFKFLFSGWARKSPYVFSILKKMLQIATTPQIIPRRIKNLKEHNQKYFLPQLWSIDNTTKQSHSWHNNQNSLSGKPNMSVKNFILLFQIFSTIFHLKNNQ